MKPIAAVIVCLLTLGSSALQSVSAAPVVCANRAEVMKRLQQRFDETPVSAGIVGDNLLEVYRSESGTFTIVITRPDGRSCLVLAGDNWRDLKPRDTKVRNQFL